MDLKKLIIAILSAVIVFLGGTTAANLSGIGGDSPSEATSTLAMGINVARNMRVLKSSGGIFDGVTIASTTAHSLTFWDATSTTDISSTTIMKLATSTDAGPYPLGLSFTRGLIIDRPAGFNGDYLPLWR